MKPTNRTKFSRPAPTRKEYDPTVAARIAPEMHRELSEIQKRLHPNMSDLVKAALKDYVRKHKPQ
jgi:predicted HicB family RNase H-like nuclease